MASDRRLVRVAAAFAAVVSMGACGVFVEVPSYARGPHLLPDGTCDAGFVDCNGDVDDGCETQIGTDDACSGCGDVCINASCSAGDDAGALACACHTGYAACGTTRACLVHVDDDPNNCGVCGHECGPGLCAGGACQPGLALAMTSPYLNVYALIGETIYAASKHEIVEAPRDAATAFADAKRLVSTSGVVYALAGDAKHLVWIEADDGTAKHAEVWTSGIDGSAPHRLAKGFAVMNLGAEETGPLAIDATHAYYTGVVGDTFDTQTTTLRRVPLAGGAVEELATEAGAYPHVTLGSEDVYWSTLTNLLYVQPIGGPSTPKAVFLGTMILGVNAHGARACAGSRGFDGRVTVYCGEGAGTYQALPTLDTRLVNNVDFDHRGVYAADGFSYEIRGVGKKPRDVIATTEGSAAGLLVVGDTFFWATTHGVFELRHAFDPR